MHPSRSICSDLGSINVLAERDKANRAVRSPLGTLPGNGYPGRQPGTTGTALVTGYHGQRAEAGR
jgi:hypothetical protein